MKPASAKSKKPPSKTKENPFGSSKPNGFITKVTEDGRECTHCGVYKKWAEFNVHSRSKTGRTSMCKLCKKENRPARDIKREGYCHRKRREELKKTVPLLVKARNIRTRLLSRLTKEDPRRATTPTAEEILAWLEKQMPLKCYYSGQLLKDKYHIDHKTPVVRGGTNELKNLCVASHHMNTAKGRMNEEEFFDLLSLIERWEDRGEGLLKRLKQGFF